MNLVDVAHVALTRKPKRGKAPEGVPDLTPAQNRELLRRLADSTDPRRYLIISRMLPGARFVLYYNVSDDVYAWNDPEGGERPSVIRRVA